MRKDGDSTEVVGRGAPQEPEESAEPTPAAAAPESPPAASDTAPAGGPLSRMMALPEPQRTDALEKAVQEGLVTLLRSRGKDIRVTYGGHVLVVPAQEPKPFVAGHAIHILWYHGDEVEEREA